MAALWEGTVVLSVNHAEHLYIEHSWGGPNAQTIKTRNLSHLTSATLNNSFQGNLNGSCSEIEKK